MPFSVTMSALLRREMAFDVLAWCNLTAAFITAAASVGLIARVELPRSVDRFGCRASRSCRSGDHRPGRLRIFRPSFTEWHDVIGFGAYSSAVSVINVIYNAWPQIFGWIFDFIAFGLYGRASGATQLFDRLFLAVLGPVIMPAISAQARAGGDLKRLYLQTVELLTAVQWPFLTFMALMAEPIVRIWFGTGWIEVVPLVRMLCLASLALFAACLTYPVLVAVGRVADTLTSSLISLPPSLLVIFVASFFGIWAVAASAFLTLPFQAAVAIYFISRQLSLSWAGLVRATLKSGIVTACSCVGVMVSVAFNDFSLALPAFGFLAAAITGLTGWWLGLVITGHPLLAQLRLAARDIPFAIPSPLSLRRPEAMRQQG
jgi:O-antigen/teichoic acid export membrane protein